MAKKLTKEEFIKKAKIIHGDKYDYSMVNYVGSCVQVNIICRIHGRFNQRPNCHIRKKAQGCPICGKERQKKLMRITRQDFITKANKTHNNKYFYDLVKYVASNIKVIIICKEHGEFEQTPNNHLNGSGCKICCGNYTLTTSEFIIKAMQVHSDTYDYSKFYYINNKTKGVIICKTHGEFYKSPNKHINSKSGCPACSILTKKNKYRKQFSDFVIEANKIHKEKYDYTNSNYINNKIKIKIICPIHGEFLQTPHNHLYGKGCSKCAHIISKPETEWLDFLKIFKENRNKIILVNKKSYRVDAIVGNTIYEFYGDFWHGNPNRFNLNKIHPFIKKSYATLFQRTCQREFIFRNAGYKMITIWESDWNEFKRNYAL